MTYACGKCGSVDVFIDERGSQKALMCRDCGTWLKWIGKKELPMVEAFINQNKSTIKQEGGNTYEIQTLKDFYKQQLMMLDLYEDSTYNRGIVKGLEIALSILEVK